LSRTTDICKQDIFKHSSTHETTQTVAGMKEKVRKIWERPTVQQGHLYARNGKPKRNTWMAAPTFDGEFV
jgi:hypothetical protein